MSEQILEQSEANKTIVDARTEKPKAEKRAIISIGVTPEEKRRISVEALKDYGTSVSDLIRSRMFIKSDAIDEKQDDPSIENDEVEVYKEVIQQLKTEISELKENNLDLKLQLQHSEESDENDENANIPSKKGHIVLLNFSQDSSGMSIAEKIKAFREDSTFEPNNGNMENKLHDFETFAKLVFLRGLKRSYNNGVLGLGTGLRISEVEQFSEVEGFEYDEEV